jgi:hypothetical protein
MTFGIYAGSVAGTETDLAIGKEDNPQLILQALMQLSCPGKIFLVRGYIHYLGEGRLGYEAPENIEQYANENRQLDIVICYRSPTYNEDDWARSIIKIINRYKHKLSTIQITEEPNLKTAFAGDGSFDNIEKALLAGVITAKKEIETQQLNIKVGFNAIPSFNPADTFWNIIGNDEFKKLREAIDYIGLDFYPDVFRPVALDGQPNDLKQSVVNVLRYFRNVNLKTGNIPLSVPIHITENGWATGATRTYERQAQVIEKIIRTILSIKDELNIDTYEVFALRDTNTLNQNIFYQFGLLNDDYLPKPAFEIYQKLIKEI